MLGKVSTRVKLRKTKEFSGNRQGCSAALLAIGFIRVGDTELASITESRRNILRAQGRCPTSATRNVCRKGHGDTGTATAVCKTEACVR